MRRPFRTPFSLTSILRAASLAACGVFLLAEVRAQTPPPRVERVAPVWRASNNIWFSLPYAYATPGEAFTAYAAWWEASATSP